MKTSEKIKGWARLGQVMYLSFKVLYVLYEKQLPTYEEPVSSGTPEEALLLVVALFCFFCITEAAVRLIGYFAELLDKN